MKRAAAKSLNDILLSGPSLRLACRIPASSRAQNSFTRPCTASISKTSSLSFRVYSASSYSSLSRGPSRPHFHSSARQPCSLPKSPSMDFDETNDPDFRAAISASLKDTHGSEGSPSSGSQRPKQDVVDLTGESDDERGQTFPKSRSVVSSDTEESDEDDDGLDLRRAIDLSMQSFREEVDLTEVPDTSEKGRKDPEPGSLSSCASVENKDAPPPMGLLGLNRKQMEEERLSRLAKRKAQDVSLDEPDSKHARTGALPQRKLYNETAAAPGLRSSPSTSHAPGDKAMQQRGPSNQPGIQFPEGIVKKTWAFGCRRAGDDIKIEEVFQQSDLELAVLSSFMWDTDWLFSKMNISKTRLLLIMQAKEEYIVSLEASIISTLPSTPLASS